MKKFIAIILSIITISLAISANWHRDMRIQEYEKL